MATIKKKTISIPVMSLLDYQKEISKSTANIRLTHEKAVRLEQKAILTPFLMDIFIGYKGGAKILFYKVIWGDILYPEANQEENSLQHVLLESSMRPIKDASELVNRTHLGGVQISFDVLKRYQIISQAFNVWDEQSEDGKKVFELIETFNEYLKKFDLKITFALVAGKTSGIAFHFKRIEKIKPVI